MVLGCAGVIFLLPLLLPKERFYSRLTAEVFALTGEQLQFEGEKTLRLTPFPTLLAKDMRLGEGLRVKEFELKLGLFWFLNDALTSYRITLIGGEAVSISRHKNWLTRLETLAKAEQSPLFGALHLRDFRYNFEGETKVRKLDASLVWSNLASPLTITGRSEEKIDFILTTAQPLNVLRHKPSDIKIEVNALHAKIQFSGVVNRPTFESLLAKGELKLTTPHVIATSQLTALKERIDLSQIKFNAQGQKGEGALTITMREEERVITGTFSSERWFLDLAKLMSQPQPDGLSHAFHLQNLPLGKIKTFFDIRFSLEELVTPAYNFTQISAIASGTAQDLTLDILHAKVLEGVIGAKIKLRPGDYHMEGWGKEVSLAGLPLPIKLQGLANLNLTLNSAQLKLEEARGNLKLYSPKGVIQGLNLEEAMGKFALSPLSRGHFLTSLGQTPYTHLETLLQFSKGEVQISSFLLETERLSLRSQGLFQLQSRMIAIDLQAELKNEPRFSLPLRLEGTLERPALRINPQNLISRSKATAPLREGARDTEAAKRVLEAIGRQVPELAPLDHLLK